MVGCESRPWKAMEDQECRQRVPKEPKCVARMPTMNVLTTHFVVLVPTHPPTLFLACPACLPSFRFIVVVSSSYLISGPDSAILI